MVMEKTAVVAAKMALEEALVAQMSALGKAGWQAAAKAVDMAVRELAMAQVVKCAQCDDGAYCAACTELLRMKIADEEDNASRALMEMDAALVMEQTTMVMTKKKELVEAVMALMSAKGKVAEATADEKAAAKAVWQAAGAAAAKAAREAAKAMMFKCAQCDDDAYCAACAELLRQTTVSEMNEAVMVVLNMKMKNEVVVPHRSVRMEVVVPPAADSKPVMGASEVATRRSVRIAAQRLRKLRGY